jgi:peptidoglycan/xylan/chitin deacetylase (PgdA/CDA1 family)
MIQTLSDFYRVPEEMLGHVCVAKPSGEAGFFRFGSEAICYGQCESGVARTVEDAGPYDALRHVRLAGSDLHLPFDLTQVIENLRRELYVQSLIPGREKLVTQECIFKTYYFVREILPVSVRRIMQRVYFSDWKTRLFPAWPVDFTVDTLHDEILRLSIEAAGAEKVPFIWYWPDGAPNCLILTHDVETSAGRDFTPQLMDLDDSYGFKASFQVIPEKRYDVPDEYVREIRNRGFEFNIHDLNHDGHLYHERKQFLRRAKKINEYVHRYKARGFRAGTMNRMLEWYDAYEFSYDLSVPNVAHLEPQRGGCCTVFPFFIGKILELPLTTSQDYSIFHILNDYSIDLWRKQLNLIRQRNGLMSFLAHPDYLVSRRTRKVYELLLDYLREMISREKIWAALPGELDQWWRTRSQLELIRKGNCWEIEGSGKERARIAYAIRNGDRLVYEVADAPVHEGANA